VKGKRLVLACLALIPVGLDAQDSDHDLNRSTRIVVDSPHFDTVVDGTRDGCPVMPMRMFGFESPESDESSPLQIYVLPQAQVRGWSEFLGGEDPFEPVLSGSTVRLRGLAESEWEVEAVSDSTGRVEVELDPGLYVLEVLRIAYRGGTGIIRVRSAESDSLQVRLDRSRICVYERTPDSV